MPAALRIGAVRYLNARPLVYGFEHGLGAARIALSHDVPARLADRLAAGALDVALLPAIELARLGPLEIVPGLGIVTDGPARSVHLVCRKPPVEVSSVALDGESRSSNALAAVLLDRVWGRRPELRPGPPDVARALESADAVVRIGDKALFDRVPEGCTAFDLGETWTRHTGLPFVFAVWATVPGVVDADLEGLFHESCARGRAAIGAIAEAFAWNGRHYPELARDYLTHNIKFGMGPRELEGLAAFLAAAAAIGVIPAAPPLRLCRSAAGAGPAGMERR